MNNLGLSADSSEVFTSLIAAKQYVKGRNLRPWLMLEEDAKLDFSDLDTENPNAVVVGLAPSNFNYQSMNQAFQYDSKVLCKLQCFTAIKIRELSLAQYLRIILY